MTPKSMSPRQGQGWNSNSTLVDPEAHSPCSMGGGMGGSGGFLSTTVDSLIHEKYVPSSRVGD